METITLENGKYTVQFNSGTGRLNSLRHGEQWRDHAGDKLILAMFPEELEKWYRRYL